MTNKDLRNWIINIENTAAEVSAQIGQAVVDSVFKKHGARSILDLNPIHYPEVFSELYAIEADLR